MVGIKPGNRLHQIQQLYLRSTSHQKVQEFFSFLLDVYACVVWMFGLPVTLTPNVDFTSEGKHRGHVRVCPYFWLAYWKCGNLRLPCIAAKSVRVPPSQPLEVLRLSGLEPESRSFLHVAEYGMDLLCDEETFVIESAKAEVFATYWMLLCSGVTVRFRFVLLVKMLGSWTIHMPSLCLNQVRITNLAFVWQK